MEYRLALGMTIALLCFDTWADSQSDGGLEGIMDRIEYRGVAPEKAAPIRAAPVRSVPVSHATSASDAAGAAHVSQPFQSAAPKPVTDAGAQPPAPPSGVWGASERPPAIPELDE